MSFGGVRPIPFVAASLAMAALLATAGVRAEETPPVDPGKPGLPKQEAPAATSSGTTGGVMVFIDPATGKIRQPSPEEIGALAAAAAVQQATPQRPPVSRTSARGGKIVLLGDSNMSYLVVTRQSDGKLKEQCVTGGQKANEIVASTPDGPTPKAEKTEAPDAH